MATYHRDIDAYIQKAAPFAQPILHHLRALVHEACPPVTESIKWSFPNFDYNGSILCSMAAFKQHCSFGFWLGELLSDPDQILSPVGERSGMGHLGKIKSLGDLPGDKVLKAYCREAMGLIDLGVKLPKKPPLTSKELNTPDYLLSALAENETARNKYEKLSVSHKKEYVEWLEEAKTEATRQRRLVQALDMLKDGKSRNWKYEKKSKAC